MAVTAKAPTGPKSWSQIELYEKCPLQYFFRYIEKVKIRSALPLKFGSAFHEFRFMYADHCNTNNLKSDWEVAPIIAKKAFDQEKVPIEAWKEFRELCEDYSHSHPFNAMMGYEVRFGMNRDMSWSTFDKCDGIRGIADGLEIAEEVGVITDAKTNRAMNLPFTQLQVYAAILSIRYPSVRRWRLVYDYVRFNRKKEEEVLAANLGEIRDWIIKKILKIEKTKKWDAEPSEDCEICSFVRVCDHKMQGSLDIEDEKGVNEAMKDYFYAKGLAASIKSSFKKIVSEYDVIRVPAGEAAFYDAEKKIADTSGLIKVLKQSGKDPKDYVTFPAAMITKIMKMDELVDEVAPYIFIEPTTRFDVKSAKKIRKERRGGS